MSIQRPPFALQAALLSVLAFSCSNEGEAPAPQEQLAGFVGASAPAPVRPKAVHSSLGAEVQVVGVMVNGPTRQTFAGDAKLAFMGSMSKTRVALEVYLPSGGIIDVDRDASSLETFRDDRGTDLVGEGSFGGPFEMMPSIAEGGRSVVVVVAGNNLPEAGAGRIELEGELSLITASIQKTHVAEAVELTPETSFELGPYHFKVTETGPAEWGDQWSFTLETEDDLTPIISWKVVDAEGHEQEASAWMSMSFNSTTRQSLQCEEVSGPVRIQIQAWDDARQIEVPFSSTAGLGLR